MTILLDVHYRLLNASRRGFEGLCHGLLEPFFPGLGQAVEMARLDAAGLDLFRFRQDGQSIEFGFQCKGFESPFGDDQYKQVKKSVQSLADSGVACENFFILVNRPVDAEYRERIARDMAPLLENGVVGSWSLYDIEGFLSLLRDKMKDLVLSYSDLHRLATASAYKAAMGWDFYIEDAPFRINDAAECAENPTAYLASLGADGVLNALVYGEFGFGKTCAALSFAENLADQGAMAIYVPLAKFNEEEFASFSPFCREIATLMLSDCSWMKSGEVLGDLLRRLAYFTVEELVGSMSVYLLLDGLDENRHLYTEGGLSAFFERVRECKCCVTLFVRKEFLHERRGNFEAAAERQLKNFVKIELCDWTDSHLSAFLSEVDRTIFEHHPKYKEFSRCVRSGEYLAKYGDIPRRPLFLKMLVDDALDGFEGGRDLPSLYERYFLRKLQFDRPALADKKSRRLFLEDKDLYQRAGVLLGVLTDVAGETAEIAPKTHPPVFDEPYEASILINPVIKESHLLAVLNRHGCGADTIDLMMNSVLVPAAARGGANMEIKFAHRSFHEWFAARAIAPRWSAIQRDYDHVHLPAGVARFLN